MRLYFFTNLLLLTILSVAITCSKLVHISTSNTINEFFSLVLQKSNQYFLTTPAIKSFRHLEFSLTLNCTLFEQKLDESKESQNSATSNNISRYFADASFNNLKALLTANEKEMITLAKGLIHLCMEWDKTKGLKEKKRNLMVKKLTDCYMFDCILKQMLLRVK